MQIPAQYPEVVELGHRLGAYLALAASSFFTEEATPLVGGLAAHDKRLHLILVIGCVAVGTWVASFALYYVGRWRASWVRQRPRVRMFLSRALKIVRKHPWRSSLAVRWAYGLRATLPIACGVAHVPILIFAIGSAISCLSWSIAFSLLGWAFGRAMLGILGHVRRYEGYLVAVILLVLLGVFVLMRKRHVENEVVEVLATGDTGPIPKVSLDD